MAGVRPNTCWANWVCSGVRALAALVVMALGLGALALKLFKSAKMIKVALAGASVAPTCATTTPIWPAGIWTIGWRVTV